MRRARASSPAVGTWSWRCSSSTSSAVCHPTSRGEPPSAAREWTDDPVFVVGADAHGAQAEAGTTGAAPCPDARKRAQVVRAVEAAVADHDRIGEPAPPPDPATDAVAARGDAGEIESKGPHADFAVAIRVQPRPAEAVRVHAGHGIVLDHDIRHVELTALGHRDAVAVPTHGHALDGHVSDDADAELEARNHTRADDPARVTPRTNPALRLAIDPDARAVAGDRVAVQRDGCSRVEHDALRGERPLRRRPADEIGLQHGHHAGGDELPAGGDVHRRGWCTKSQCHEGHPSAPKHVTTLPHAAPERKHLPAVPWLAARASW